MYLDGFVTIFAHSVQGGGFINGLIHPVFGTDHLLAMVAVGILSVQIGKSAIWKVPSAFVGVMALGALLALVGVDIIGIEQGITFSVFALGLALALEKKLHIIWAMIFVAGFGAFHGYAHGTEMPSLSSPILYVIGFVFSTTILHITGVGIGILSKRIKNGETILRYFGAGIAGIGFAMLFGL